MTAPADDKFAKLVRKMRFLTDAQVDTLRDRQKEIERVGASISLFDVAHSDMVLTQEQLDKVQLASEYTEMLDEEKRIGALAVKKGLASGEEVAVCLDTQKYEFASQRSIPRRLTEIMVEAEILSSETSRDLLRAFESEEEMAKPAGKVGSTVRLAPVGGAPGPRKGSSATLKATKATAAAPGGEGDSETTIPYDKNRIEDADVPPDAVPELDTPVDPSGTNVGARQGASPGRAVPTEGVTRRLTARLVLETGDPPGRAVALTGRGRIGRQTGCMVKIDDSRASREHAQIDYDTQLRHHVVSDLESRNGTYVNDQKITEPTVLNPGDRIRIGDSIMRYEA
jgi:hypothetical protein